MGIVPLIIEGEGKNVVDNLDEFKIDGNAILILNRDENQLREPNETNISYDLRIGGRYRDYRDREPTTLRDGGEIILSPQSAVIIETEEDIQLPRTLFGYVQPKVSILQNGMSNISSKVDPGYRGHLLVPLFNLGSQTQKLKKGAKFCSLHLAKIDGNVRVRNKNPQQIEGYGKAGLYQNFKDFSREYDSQIKLLIILGSIVLWLKECA